MPDNLPVSRFMLVFFILFFNCLRMWATSTAKWYLPAGPEVTSSRTCWKTTAPQTTTTAKSPTWAQHQTPAKGNRWGVPLWMPGNDLFSFSPARVQALTSLTWQRSCPGSSRSRATWPKVKENLMSNHLLHSVWKIPDGVSPPALPVPL